MNGVHCGLRLPVKMRATSEARCPTVWPAASTTYQFLFPARSLPLGKYVDIVNYLYLKRIKRERQEYRSAQNIVKLERIRAPHTNLNQMIVRPILENVLIAFACE